MTGFPPVFMIRWSQQTVRFMDAINHLLQGDLIKSATMLGRFGVNSTIGILGFFDPATAIGPESDYVLGAKALDIVDGRHRYEQLIDQTLYESVDSYSATRTGYLQSTRTLLKGQTDESDLEDPFAFE